MEYFHTSQGDTEHFYTINLTVMWSLVFFRTNYRCQIMYLANVSVNVRKTRSTADMLLHLLTDICDMQYVSYSPHSGCVAMILTQNQSKGYVAKQGGL